MCCNNRYSGSVFSDFSINYTSTKHHDKTLSHNHTISCRNQYTPLYSDSWTLANPRNPNRCFDTTSGAVPLHWLRRGHSPRKPGALAYRVRRRALAGD